MENPIPFPTRIRSPASEQLSAASTALLLSTRRIISSGITAAPQGSYGQQNAGHGGLSGGDHPVMPENTGNAPTPTKVHPDRLSNTQREAHHYNNPPPNPLGTI
ncbi:Hypothetical protein CUL131002_0167c [Corynebacterium ulcerans]|nr:Hypothetical protein CUL131002_0167c [Corynebacterium ulcerans]